MIRDQKAEREACISSASQHALGTIAKVNAIARTAEKQRLARQMVSDAKKWAPRLLGKGRELWEPFKWAGTGLVRNTIQGMMERERARQEKEAADKSAHEQYLQRGVTKADQATGERTFTATNYKEKTAPSWRPNGEVGAWSQNQKRQWVFSFENKKPPPPPKKDDK